VARCVQVASTQNIPVARPVWPFANSVKGIFLFSAASRCTCASAAGVVEDDEEHSGRVREKSEKKSIYSTNNI
jgi:hypothetical protein